MQIDLTPTPQTKALLKRFSDTNIIKQASRQGITRASLLFKGKAQENAPIDKGDLRRSILYKVQSDYQSKIYNKLDYAIYQEHGTGIYAGKGYIRPKRAKFLAFKSKGGKMIFAKKVKGVKGRKFFEKAGNYLKMNSKKISDVIYNYLRSKL